jgi:hypothetical protein
MACPVETSPRSAEPIKPGIPLSNLVVRQLVVTRPAMTRSG